MNENVRPDVANKVEDPEAFVAQIKAKAAADREQRLKLQAEHPPIELLRRLANPANPHPNKPLLKSVPVEADRLKTDAKAEPKADGQRSKTQAKALEQVEALNEKHFVVNNIGGKCLIGEFVPSSIDPKRTVLAWQSPNAFMTRYGNQKVGVVQEDSTTAKELGWYWLKHRNRRSYEGIELVPNGPAILPGNRFNLWRGFGVTPKKGDWSLIRKHIREILANNDPKAEDYIIRWVAWGIQHPDMLPLVALVLIGHKGRGKGTFARVLEIIYGNHALQISSQRHIVGNFNAHLENLVLMISDEAYWAGHKADAGTLQRMITEPTLAIEAKGCDVRNVKNYIHLLMLAEPGWSVPAGQDERRYAVFEVSEDIRDKTYFDALYQEIDGDGPAAMLHELQQMDLGDWHPRQIYKTDALRYQQELSLSPLDEWMLGLLEDGKLPGTLRARPRTANPTTLLYHAQKKILRLHDLGKNKLADYLRRQWQCTPHGGDPRGWNFPPLPEMRNIWDKRFGQRKWPKHSDWGSPIKPDNPATLK